jgi:hypothetical protein
MQVVRIVFVDGPELLRLRRWTLCPPSSATVVSWNIDRGLKLQGVIEFLSRARADIILLQEAALNAGARTT